MKVTFTKMQGAGNDFVVIDATSESFALSPAQVKMLGDRHFGVGCDQILVVEKASGPHADFGYRIFNADGGEVEQCGNGARCFVKFVHQRGLTKKKAIRVETLSGVIEPRLEEDGQVSVNMGPPVFDLEKVPFAGEEAGLVHYIEVNGEAVEVAVLSMGNPHAVQVVEDVDSAPVATQGPLIEHHPQFPSRVNAGYMQVIDGHSIRLRVFERGAGETLACGTGACAAVVSGIERALLESPVDVETRGGRLTIAWAGGDNPVWMKGPAICVFEGTIEL